MPIRVKDWTKVDGTIPNVRLVESEAEPVGQWAFVTVGVAIGFLVGQLTHWIF